MGNLTAFSNVSNRMINMVTRVRPTSRAPAEFIATVSSDSQPTS
jgi:hypothetical protein